VRLRSGRRISGFWHRAGGRPLQLLPTRSAVNLSPINLQTSRLVAGRWRRRRRLCCVEMCICADANARALPCLNEAVSPCNYSRCPMRTRLNITVATRRQSLQCSCRPTSSQELSADGRHTAVSDSRWSHFYLVSETKANCESPFKFHF